ncbi:MULTISPECIES: glutathione S-transferase family protein [unclassified Roseateles]|uniref:glutathione S-transferase family protein n=1 Tax=unclassified Roseateles TaxID=2626991 RepID=UPI0006F4E6DC|nr:MULTISPECIES: glutathione S-transferase [unclassified Roseateles]KQW46321.1 glutathione S-transferase [Pelomonas sp. Root405]KRA73370.1 glutathione S-transferase [Pelomonas sp. Root662]
MKLLGRLTSINVRKVMWTAAQLDLPLDREDWGAGFRSPQEAGYLAMNPNGLIPVLIDGDFALWESNTICRYLATQRYATTLLPTEAQARAKVEQWMDWQAGELNNSWRVAFMALVRGQPATPDAIEAGVANWNRHMGMLDAQLAQTGAHVTGDDFTLADVVLGLSAQRWKNAPITRVDLPAVEAWMQRLGARPGFAEFVDNGMP